MSRRRRYPSPVMTSWSFRSWSRPRNYCSSAQAGAGCGQRQVDEVAIDVAADARVVEVRRVCRARAAQLGEEPPAVEQSGQGDGTGVRRGRVPLGAHDQHRGCALGVEVAAPVAGWVGRRPPAAGRTVGAVVDGRPEDQRGTQPRGEPGAAQGVLLELGRGDAAGRVGALDGDVGRPACSDQVVVGDDRPAGRDGGQRLPGVLPGPTAAAGLEVEDLGHGVAVGHRPSLAVSLDQRRVVQAADEVVDGRLGVAVTEGAGPRPLRAPGEEGVDRAFAGPGVELEQAEEVVAVLPRVHGAVERQGPDPGGVEVGVHRAEVGPVGEAQVAQLLVADGGAEPVEVADGVLGAGEVHQVAAGLAAARGVLSAGP